MEDLTIRMDEWFFTQGLIGYKKILENYGEKVRTTYDGIIVERRHLEKFADAFFHYYLTQYSVADREERYWRSLHHKFKNGESSAKSELNQSVNKRKKDVEKYFKDTSDGQRFIVAAEAYRKEKTYTDALDQYLDEMLEVFHTKAINDKLTANFFKARHLSPHYGQVSFLNVSKYALSVEEQKGVFHRDFIVPILEEWALWSALNANDEDKVFQVLKETPHQSLKSLEKKFRKKSVEEMKDYLYQEINQCSFTDFPLAFHSFEEGIFSPLALSLKNINVTWDAKGSYYPLSSLARLIIFCSQAGATQSQGKSVFIFYGGTFDELYRSNRFYTDMKNPNKTFDELVFSLVREQKLKADYLRKHYIIFEYSSNYDAKKTELDYMIMSPSVIRLFSEHGTLFNQIHYVNRHNFIRGLLQNYDTKHLIFNVLRDKIKSAYSTLEVIRMTQLRHLNQRYEKGETGVDANLEKRYVWVLAKSAEEVKRKIGDKKAQGIAYRLLNAVRSNNKNTFMDTVMRVYISCDAEMPGILLEALHENHLDFATVGNAWISGLVSKPNEINEGEKKDDEK